MCVHLYEHYIRPKETIDDKTHISCADQFRFHFHRFQFSILLLFAESLYYISQFIFFDRESRRGCAFQCILYRIKKLCRQTAQPAPYTRQVLYSLRCHFFSMFLRDQVFRFATTCDGAIFSYQFHLRRIQPNVILLSKRHSYTQHIVHN